MQIKEEIDRIIEKRKNKIPQIEEYKNRIEKIGEELSTVNELRDEMLRRDNGNEGISYEEKSQIEGLNITNYMRTSDALLRKCDDVIQRFSRNEISIAVVGGARQGKSKLLQSISNLDNSVIPAFEGTDCTGTVSVIKNVPNSSVTADVTFMKESEMIKNVQVYLDTILGKNVIELGSFEEIGRLNLAEIKGKISKGSPDSLKFEHLKKYVEHFSEWSPLVRKGRMTITDESEIQKYVAQHNGKDEGDAERRDYYNYLAVKEVVISCEFQNPDTGKIVLRDTIGLGDTALGIEDKMIDAIGKESDAAIIVKRPEAAVGKLDNTDEEIYRKLYENFQNRNMDKWLFWLINQTSSGVLGDNSNRCKALDDKIAKTGWKIAGHYIIDVSDGEKVNNYLLVKVLETLIANIDAIDSGIISEINDSARVLYGEKEKIRRTVSDVLEMNINPMDKVEFLNERWENFYARTLMKAIKEYKGELKNKKDEESNEFKKRIEEILNNSIKLLPQEEEIKEDLEAGGKAEPIYVYIRHTEKLRTNFTEQFLEIDEQVFDAQVKNFKEKIVDIFAEDSGGRLKYVQPINENAKKSEWLRDVANNVFDKKSRYAQFKTAFLMLADFNMTVRGFLMHRIRSGIDRLELGTDYHFTDAGRTSEQAGEIYRILKKNLQRVCEELKCTLEKEEFYKDPNRILYAVISEFYDRINFSYTVNGSQDVETAWRSLYLENASKIWKDEFRNSEEINDIYDRTVSILKNLEGYSLDDFKVKLKEGC